MSDESPYKRCEAIGQMVHVDVCAHRKENPIPPRAECVRCAIGREGLESYRERRGWSQKQMANLLGVNLKTYQALEFGERRLTLSHCTKLSGEYTGDLSLDERLGKNIEIPDSSKKTQKENKGIELDTEELREALTEGKLKSYRKTQKITQEDLARTLGISDRHLRRFEKGEKAPPLHVIEMLKNASENVRFAGGRVGIGNSLKPDKIGVISSVISIPQFLPLTLFF